MATVDTLPSSTDDARHRHGYRDVDTIPDIKQYSEMTQQEMGNAMLRQAKGMKGAKADYKTISQPTDTNTTAYILKNALDTYTSLFHDHSDPKDVEFLKNFQEQSFDENRVDSGITEASDRLLARVKSNQEIIEKDQWTRQYFKSLAQRAMKERFGDWMTTDGDDGLTTQGKGSKTASRTLGPSTGRMLGQLGDDGSTADKTLGPENSMLPDIKSVGMTAPDDTTTAKDTAASLSTAKKTAHRKRLRAQKQAEEASRLKQESETSMENDNHTIGTSKGPSTANFSKAGSNTGKSTKSRRRPGTLGRQTRSRPESTLKSRPKQRKRRPKKDAVTDISREAVPPPVNSIGVDDSTRSVNTILGDTSPIDLASQPELTRGNDTTNTINDTTRPEAPLKSAMKGVQKRGLETDNKSNFPTDSDDQSRLTKRQLPQSTIDSGRPDFHSQGGTTDTIVAHRPKRTADIKNTDTTVALREPAITNAKTSTDAATNTNMNTDTSMIPFDNPLSRFTNMGFNMRPTEPDWTRDQIAKSQPQTSQSMSGFGTNENRIFNLFQNLVEENTNIGPTQTQACIIEDPNATTHIMQNLGQNRRVTMTVTRSVGPSRLDDLFAPFTSNIQDNWMDPFRSMMSMPSGFDLRTNMGNTFDTQYGGDYMTRGLTSEPGQDGSSRVQEVV